MQSRGAAFAKTIARVAACAIMGGCSSLPALLGVGGNLADEQLDLGHSRTFDHPMEIVRATVMWSLVELGLDVEAIDGRGRKQHTRRAATPGSRCVPRNAAKILESAETS